MYSTNVNNGRFAWIFYDSYMKRSNLQVCIYAAFAIWFFEWIYLIQYLLSFWSYTRIIFPHRIPVSLMLCFMYWLYVWGISIWRRTLFGKFTRGDRKLWFKGFTSFWFIELSTILGIYVAACWMSWGPLPLMPRYFLMQKKGFLFEITLFTYIVWLIYLMRLGLKWYLWRTQAIITSLIIFIICCLLWRDFITLYTREITDVDAGSKWRYVKLNSVIYSLSDTWWMQHFMGDTASKETLYPPLQKYLDNNFQGSPIDDYINLTEYQKYHWMPILTNVDYYLEAFPFILIIDNHFHLYLQNIINEDVMVYNECFIMLDSTIFYPRKIGFYPKKIAMWYFLVVLKIWHHIMLFIWWFFYLLRLDTKKKSSYTMLSACYFNVYCCFLICVLVYCFNLLPVWENFFRIKPYIRPKLQNWNIWNEGFLYCFDLFTFESSAKGSKRLLTELFFSMSKHFIIDYNRIFEAKIEDSLIDADVISYFYICR